MTRIVFVDDEQRVLDGLRRALRPMRKEWDMEFFLDGPSVLARLNEKHFDVVVSDARMPGMDGLELLKEVRRRHPEIVRMVLSGQTDLSNSLHLSRIAHQFLAKPCDVDELREVINRSTALQHRLRSPSLLRLVSGIANLPSMPELYAELLDLVEDPNTSLAEIAGVIGRDPAMTAKVLQLVNSSFFGLRRRTTDPVHAVMLLGVNTLVALVLGVHLFTALKDADGAGESIDLLYRRSLDTAAGVRAIAIHEGHNRDSVSEFYLAGMLHDCGRLILAANFPRQYRRTAALAPSDLSAEEAVFGATHQDVGAYLLGLWGLPDTVVEATAFHHTPHETPTRSFSPVTAVHVAGAVVAAGGEEPRLDLSYLDETGVGDKVDDWIEIVRSVREEEAA